MDFSNFFNLIKVIIDSGYNHSKQFRHSLLRQPKRIDIKDDLHLILSTCSLIKKNC